MNRIARYVHTGAWSTAMTIASLLAPGAAPVIERVAIDSAAASSPTLSSLIASTLERHLTAEEPATIGETDKAMTVNDAGWKVAGTNAAKAGADIGFIGHTSLGAGLPNR